MPANPKRLQTTYTTTAVIQAASSHFDKVTVQALLTGLDLAAMSSGDQHR